RRREELAPLTATGGDEPGREREEEGRELRQRVGQEGEQQHPRGDAELGREARRPDAEDDRLRAERERGRATHEEDRQRPRLLVHPARKAVPGGGRDRERAPRDEAGDTGEGMEGEHEAGPEEHVAGGGEGGGCG